MRSPVVGEQDVPWESSEDRGERARERVPDDSSLLLNELVVSINGFPWRWVSASAVVVSRWVTDLGFGIPSGMGPFFSLGPRGGDGLGS